MKRFFTLILIGGLLMPLVACVGTSAKKESTMVGGDKGLAPPPPAAVAGGYRQTAADSQEIFEIVRFMEAELYARDGSQALSVKKVLKAETQVVAGTNYRLKLLMSNNKTYEAVIYQDLQGAAELTSYKRT